MAERFLRSVALELTPATTARYEEHWQVAPALGAIAVARLKKTRLTELYAKAANPSFTVGVPERSLATARSRSESANRSAATRRFASTASSIAFSNSPLMKNSLRETSHTLREVAAILDTSEGSQYHEFFVVLAHTALRRGEAGALCWDAINFDRGLATVRQAIGEDRRGGRFLKAPESGRTREVPLDVDALDALRRQHARQATEKLAAPQDCYVDQGLIFADELGGMLDLDAVSKSFSAMAAKAAVKDKRFSLHSLRHFGATEALANGSDHRSVSALLGHADPAVALRVYGHIVPGAQERAVASIGGAISAAQARREAAQK